jgi:hypothetical protein
VIPRYCGDGVCTDGEDQYNCPADCGTIKYCGDGACNNGETKETCPQDCGLPPYCGDGICDLQTETQNTCPQDCGNPATHNIAILPVDECQEVVIASSGVYTLSIINNGNMIENLELSASGDAAPWVNQPPGVTLSPGQTVSWEVILNVPQVEPGLYNATITARNQDVESSTVVHVDVKLPESEEMIEAVPEGSEIEEEGPTGAAIAISVPDWALIVMAILIVVLVGYILFRIIAPQNKLAVKKTTLTTDGGFR